MSEILYAINDALTAIASEHNLFANLTDDEGDERLNEATHAAYNTLTETTK